MKPDIVKFNCLKRIDGYIGVFCRCGRTLYIKNVQSKARRGVDIECPCGETIHTVYTMPDYYEYKDESNCLDLEVRR